MTVLPSHPSFGARGIRGAAAALAACGLVAVVSVGLETVPDFARAQGPGSQASTGAPLPPGVLVRVNGEEISTERYQEYLFREIHLDRLMSLVDDMLIEARARSLGIVITQEELEEVVEQRIQNQVEQIHKGDREAFIKWLGRRFRTLEVHRRWEMAHSRRRMLTERCIMKQRTVTDDDVRKKFEEMYGVDGVHYQVNHILLRTRGRRGEPARDRGPEAQEILGKLEKAPDSFARLVEEYSEDEMTKRNKGFIPNYRQQLFGPRFHDVVGSLKDEGEIGGPVDSDYGVHIVQLVSRTETRLEEVQDEIREELRQRRVGPQEIGSFRKKLREDAKIEM